MHEHINETTALQLILDRWLPVAESRYGVPYTADPVSVGRVEIGWLFEFAPTQQFNGAGHKMYHLRFIVDDLERRVHTVGTPGVQRAIDRIKRQRE